MVHRQRISNGKQQMAKRKLQGPLATCSLPCDAFAPPEGRGWTATGAFTSRRGPGLRPPKGYGRSGRTARYGQQAGEGSLARRDGHSETRLVKWKSKRIGRYRRNGYSNSQPPPQGKLQLDHFTLIRLVIVAQQVQEAVQNKPADLIQG